MRIWNRILAFSVVAVAALAMVACGGGDDDDTSSPTVEPGAAFEGPVGEFVVSPNGGAAYPCEGAHNIPLEEAQLSPLYSPDFDPESEVSACADGTVISINNGGDEIMGRRLFVGNANVPFEAPQNHLRALEVEGCPAIMQDPTPEGSRTRRLAVIERAPDGDDVGVMVWIDNTALSEEETVALLEPFVNDC